MTPNELVTNLQKLGLLNKKLKIKSIEYIPTVCGINTSNHQLNLIKQTIKKK